MMREKPHGYSPSFLSFIIMSLSQMRERAERSKSRKEQKRAEQHQAASALVRAALITEQ